MFKKLTEKYNNEAVPAMREKFSYKNNMAVPKIEKVIVNTGFGRQITQKTSDEQKKYIEFVVEDISQITGQKAVKTFAKKAIAGFKIRKGMPIGVKVTLRGKRMNSFLERFIHLTLPRTRDFRGIDKKSVDRNGNLTIGIKEHIAFPEVLPEKIKSIFGLEITVTTTAKTKDEGLELFKLLGFPIKR